MARKKKAEAAIVAENPVTEVPVEVVEQSAPTEQPVQQVTAEKHAKIDGVYLAKQLGADRIHQDEQSITLRKGGVEVSANIKQPVEDILRAFRQMGF